MHCNESETKKGFINFFDEGGGSAFSRHPTVGKIFLGYDLTERISGGILNPFGSTTMASAIVSVAAVTCYHRFSTE